jgi:transposase
VDSFDGFSFAHKEGSYNSTNHVVESLKNFPLKSGIDLIFDNVAFQHAACFRAFADYVGVELLFIRPYSRWFSSVERGFSIARHNDRFTR